MAKERGRGINIVAKQKDCGARLEEVISDDAVLKARIRRLVIKTISLGVNLTAGAFCF